MTLAAFNSQSAFLTACAEKGLLDDLTFSLIDVGCSGGINPFWDQFGKRFRAVGFDPLVSEVERLNSETAGNRILYIAAWVGAGSRPLPADITIHPVPEKGPYSVFTLTSASRAFEKTKRSITAEVFNRGAELRFADRRLSVDEWLTENDFGRVDVLKCDVDGFDFEVFVGAEVLLSGPERPLALITEAQLHEPRDRRGTAFGDLDRHLRDRGYRLFDIDIHRYSRAELPAPFAITLFAQTSTGQAVHCDALYMLDPVMDPSILDEMVSRGDEMALLKLVLLYEVFGLPDCAAALLVRLREFGINSCGLDIEWALDRLVPENPYGTTTHRAYLQAFDANPQSLFPAPAVYIMPVGTVVDWTEDMIASGGCTREGMIILSPKGRGGHMFFGPYQPLPPGTYRGTIILDVNAGPRPTQLSEVTLEAVGNEVVLSRSSLAGLRTGAHVVDIDFAIPDGASSVKVQLRLSVNTSAEQRLRRAMVQKVA